MLYAHEAHKNVFAGILLWGKTTNIKGLKILNSEDFVFRRITVSALFILVHECASKGFATQQADSAHQACKKLVKVNVDKSQHQAVVGLQLKLLTVISCCRREKPAQVIIMWNARRWVQPSELGACSRAFRNPALHMMTFMMEPE